MLCCDVLCYAGLRSAEEQLWLSRLSQAPAVRLVASVDHVNAALLWNSRVAAAFNWLWVHGTTYAAYNAETANVAPIITSKAQLARSLLSHFAITATSSTST
jgi:origin recognition complex subunit 2